MFESVQKFSLDVLEKLKNLNLDVSSFEMDHVCYRVETEKEYRESFELLSSLGTLLVEDMIGGRLISTFKLNEPITVDSTRQVRLVELPMPKPGTYYPTGWEHAEFVIGKDADLETFMASQSPELVWDKAGMKKSFNQDVRLELQQTPPMSVKFHHLPLDQVIAIEIAAKSK